jgi:predicted house-cleaning noncanonical NTP pyrophosphatase (MazG superfamily)
MSEAKIYNKLVRDLIPRVIEQTGKTCTTHLADEAEYRQALSDKLSEEVAEFLAKPCEEEMADIFEVMDCLIECYGFDPDHIQAIKAQKKAERGGFAGRLILETVEDQLV